MGTENLPGAFAVGSTTWMGGMVTNLTDLFPPPLAFGAVQNSFRLVRRPPALFLLPPPPPSARNPAPAPFLPPSHTINFMALP